MSSFARVLVTISDLLGSFFGTSGHHGLGWIIDWLSFDYRNPHRVWVSTLFLPSGTRKCFHSWWMICPRHTRSCRRYSLNGKSWSLIFDLWSNQSKCSNDWNNGTCIQLQAKHSYQRRQSTIGLFWWCLPLHCESCNLMGYGRQGAIDNWSTVERYFSRGILLEIKDARVLGIRERFSWISIRGKIRHHGITCSITKTYGDKEEEPEIKMPKHPERIFLIEEREYTKREQIHWKETTWYRMRCLSVFYIEQYYRPF